MRNFILIVLVICSIIFSCSKDRLTDPEELGGEIALNYVEMMEELSSILSAQPDADDLKPQLADLKDKYIEIFVELGKYRSEMIEQDQSIVDSALWSGIQELDSGVWNIISQAGSEYWNIDMEVSNEIASFNVITQYAFYELLKQQMPEEAERLGIE